MASLISVSYFQHVCLLLYSVSGILCQNTPSDHTSPETGPNYNQSDYISHVDRIIEYQRPALEALGVPVSADKLKAAFLKLHGIRAENVTVTTFTSEIIDELQTEQPVNMTKALPLATEKPLAMLTTTSKLRNNDSHEPPMVASMRAEPGTRSEPVPRLKAFYAPSLQWHVGIYTKTFTPYMQVCGGSLVKNDVVLSAAHCFWKDDVGALRPALFAVAAGKLLRPWHTSVEDLAQYSDVKIIKIPPRFHGGRTSFQEDMAIVMTSDPFEFGPGVMPICINFDLALDRSQLKSGNMGKIAGWGLTEPNGPPSQRLNFLELPYVDIEQCIRTAEPSFLRYITSDKICAGDQKSGRALCRGDSGGGLVFEEAGVPYLRGIASTAPRDRNECNAYAVASFTHVRAHMTFLVEHVPDIAEGCEELYGKTSEENATEQTQGITISSLRQGEQNGGQTKVVMMNVESGGRSMMAVPMDHNVNTIVFNCFCKEHGTK